MTEGTNKQTHERIAKPELLYMGSDYAFIFHCIGIFCGPDMRSRFWYGMVQGGAAQKGGWGNQMRTYVQQLEPGARYNPLGGRETQYCTGVVKWPGERYGQVW